MKKLNDITLFEVKCPRCKFINPEKHIQAEYIEWESKKREALMCNECDFDIYEHGKKELEESI